MTANRTIARRAEMSCRLAELRRLAVIRERERRAAARKQRDRR